MVSSVLATDFMDRLLRSAVKLELLKGHVYEMSGSRRDHSRIQSNIARLVYDGGIAPELEYFGPDQSVRISQESYVFPDASLALGAEFERFRGIDALVNPLVIVEVLSPSTAEHDLARKQPLYRSLPTLQAIVYIDSSQPWLEVLLRSPEGEWSVKDLGLEAELELEVIGLRIPVRELYHRVSFDSVEA